MIVCLCRRVSDTTIQKAVDAGATTVEAVGQVCGAGTGCGGCKEAIGEIIRDCGSCENRCSSPRRPVPSPYLAAAGVSR